MSSLKVENCVVEGNIVILDTSQSRQGCSSNSS